MDKQRFLQKPMSVKRSIPFVDAEEAWFWYVRSERARREGARQTNVYASETRPCEPDDLYRFVMSLHRQHLLKDEHLKVLATFGWRACPPDGRVFEEEYAVRLWDEALDRLSTILKIRGIIYHDEQCHGPNR